MNSNGLERDAVVTHLERVLSSTPFRHAERSAGLLRYLVERSLDGAGDRLKEYTVGVEALARGTEFDPRTDPIVRAEASRLRGRLERYYATEGSADSLVIALPKGTYVPQFRSNGVGAVEAKQREDDRTSPGRADQHRGGPLAWLAAACVVAVGVFSTGLWLGNRGVRLADQPPSQFEVELKSGGALGSDVGTDVAISRDGTRLAWVSISHDGIARLNTRLFAESESHALAGTDGVRGPFFSPDGRWIGFLAGGKLKQVPVAGGSPVVLCDATDLLGASWDDDGSIVATLNSKGILWRVPAGGGVPAPIVDLSKDGVGPRWPQVLPGGTHVLYSAINGFEADHGSIEILSIRDGTRKVLVRGATFGRYLSAGFFSYVNQGTLYVAPFDLDKLEMRGPPVPVLDGISYSSTFGYAQVAISETGTVVYRKSAGDGRVVAVWLDSAGTQEPLVDSPGRFTTPRLSPDGRRFAMSVEDGGIQSVAFYELRGGRAVRSANSAAKYAFALWSPDSRFVVMGDATGIAWTQADGAEPQSLLRSGTIQLPWSFTPNGDRLAYHQMNPATAFDLWTVPIRSDEHGLHAGMPEPYLRTVALEVFPAFSPDGRWLAYGSNETGPTEVYVRRFPDDGSKVRVSTGGARAPRWSRNGRDLFYGTDDQRLMVVHYRTNGASFVAEAPREWGHVRLADTGVLPNYDLAADGARVIGLVPAPTTVPSQTENHVTVILNFFGELRHRTAAPRASQRLMNAAP